MSGTSIGSLFIGGVRPGLLLFMMTKVANVSLIALLREAFAFPLVMLDALALVTVWPGIVLLLLLLPRLAGYIG